MVDERTWFEQLYRAHATEILRLGVRSTDDRADAEDLLAETFAVVWRRRADRGSITLPRAWIYGIARGVLANQRRGRNRRRRLMTKATHVFDPVTPDDATEALEAEEERSRVRAALQSLRDADRELLILSVWQELTRDELADIYDCRPNAISVRLTRARTRLAAALDAVDAVEDGRLDERSPSAERPTAAPMGLKPARRDGHLMAAPSSETAEHDEEQR